LGFNSVIKGTAPGWEITVNGGKSITSIACNAGKGSVDTAAASAGLKVRANAQKVFIFK
jgi:hypothetical protein